MSAPMNEREVYERYMAASKAAVEQFENLKGKFEIVALSANAWAAEQFKKEIEQYEVLRKKEGEALKTWLESLENDGDDWRQD